MTDENGEFDYARIRSFVSVLACVAGVVLAVFTAVHDLAQPANVVAPSHEVLGWIITALVLPITGGRVAEGVGHGIAAIRGSGPHPAITTPDP